MCINSDCRFYQRIVMVFIIFYSISLNAPFIQGILAFLVCIIILIMDSMCVHCARSLFLLQLQAHTLVAAFPPAFLDFCLAPGSSRTKTGICSSSPRFARSCWY